MKNVEITNLNIGADLDHNQGEIHSEIENIQETKIAEEDFQLENLNQETKDDVEQESFLSDSNIEEITILQIILRKKFLINMKI